VASKKLKFAEGPVGVNSMQSVEVEPSEFLNVHANDLFPSLASQFPARAEAEYDNKPASVQSTTAAQRATDFVMVRDPPRPTIGFCGHSSATRVTRAAEYPRAAVLIRRLPVEFLTLNRSVEPASITVVTLESIGRAIELRRFERTRRAAGAAIVVEIGFSVFGENVEVL
jgi:hypothetical protein